MEEAIYRARVFVLPSNTEGMPNTLIEAMLLGLTVIATDCPCGGCAELIEHEQNGLLTPVEDVEKMRENLRRVLAHPREADGKKCGSAQRSVSGPGGLRRLEGISGGLDGRKSLNDRERQINLPLIIKEAEQRSGSDVWNSRIL